MAARSVTIIVCPYHVGVQEYRVGTGPNSIRKHGVETELKKLGVKVDVIEIDPVDEFEGEIGRSFELLRRISKTVSDVVATNSFPLVLSGNCNASVGVAAGLGTHDLGFVWMDAHADFDTPDVHTSGYFDSMGVSMLNGQSWHALMETIPGHVPRKLDRFVYCGLCDLSDAQRQRVVDARIDVIWGRLEEQQPDFAADLGNLLATRSFSPALVHVDLDVLDDSIGAANEYHAPGGLLESDLQKCMEMLPSAVKPASLTIASFNADLEGGAQIAQIAVRGVTTFFTSLMREKLLLTHK